MDIKEFKIEFEKRAKDFGLHGMIMPTLRATFHEYLPESHELFKLSYRRLLFTDRELYKSSWTGEYLDTSRDAIYAFFAANREFLVDANIKLKLDISVSINKKEITMFNLDY